MTRDLREYARKTNLRLFAGFFIILLLIGDGLIYWFYGTAAAISGLLCIGAGAAPLLLIWLAMTVLEWIGKKTNE